MFWDLVPKFILEQKRNVFRILVSIALPIMICLIVYAVASRHILREAGVPNLTVTGSSYRHEVIAYKPINTSDIEAIQDQLQRDIVMIPFVYRNIMSFPSPDLKIQYWFQILYLDIAQLRSYLPVLADGRYPVAGQREVLIGDQAAQQWELEIGDVFTYDPARYLFDYVKPKPDDPGAYKVVGILGHDLPFDFFNGSILLPHGVQTTRSKSMLPFNGFFIYQKNGSFQLDVLIKKFYEHHISPLFTRRNLTDLSAINILAALLLLVVVLNLLSACSAYIDQNMKNIALLKAFGMSNSHISLVFTAGLFVLEIIGLLIGIGLSHMALVGLNRSYSKPFEYVYQYYYMPPAGYIVVAILLVLMALGSNYFVFFKINRLSPAQVLINEQ